MQFRRNIIGRWTKSEEIQRTKPCLNCIVKTIRGRKGWIVTHLLGESLNEWSKSWIKHQLLETMVGHARGKEACNHGQTAINGEEDERNFPSSIHQPHLWGHTIFPKDWKFLQVEVRFANPKRMLIKKRHMEIEEATECMMNITCPPCNTLTSKTK